MFSYYEDITEIQVVEDAQNTGDPGLNPDQIFFAVIIIRNNNYLDFKKLIILLRSF